jgi:hypothetical protein
MSAKRECVTKKNNLFTPFTKDYAPALEATLVAGFGPASAVNAVVTLFSFLTARRETWEDVLTRQEHI